MDRGDEEAEKIVRTGDVDVMDLVPWFGLCCCIFSMYTTLPDCCGTVCENVICCIGCKCMTCKPSKEEGAMCKLLGADIDCVPFKVCCQVLLSTLLCEAPQSFKNFFYRDAHNYCAWIVAYPSPQRRKFLAWCPAASSRCDEFSVCFPNWLKHLSRQCFYEYQCVCKCMSEVRQLQEKRDRGRVNGEQGEQGDWVQKTDEATGQK